MSRVVPKSFPPKTSIWITAKRESIFIRQMETDHIINCIQMIRDSIHAYAFGIGRPFRVRFLPRLRYELKRRGATITPGWNN